MKARASEDSEGMWIPVSEAAARLGVSERTVYARIQRGELDAKKENGRTFVGTRTSEGAQNVSEALRKPSEGVPDAGSEDFRTLRKEKDRLLNLVETLTEEVKTIQEKWSAERERVDKERHETNAILMQQARTMEGLTGEVNRLRALTNQEIPPARKKWWQRWLGR